MRKRAIILAIALVIACLILGIMALRAGIRWRVELAQEWATGGMRYRRFHASTHTRQCDLDVVRIARQDLHAALLPIDPQTPSPLKANLADASVVINGGYFDPEHQPVGLLRIEGREIAPLKSQAPFSGALVIDDRGILSIHPTSDATSDHAHNALQAGPFLIDPGGAIGIRSDTGELAERTVLATSDDFVCIIRTTPLSLHELATLLHDHAGAFGVERFDRALNLDGGPSSGIAIRAGAHEVIREPRGPIVNVIVLRAE